MSSKRIIVYYSDWCIYDRKYLPNDVPFDKVTHIQFCFLKPKPDGSIEFADPWADWQIKYQQYGDSWNEPADVANGILKQFFLAKQKNRNLKIILSPLI